MKTRPTVSGSNGGVNFNSAPTPAAISQKISAGAVLSLSLCCAVPVEAAMGVVSSAVVLTQTSVLLVNMQVQLRHFCLRKRFGLIFSLDVQHFRLDQAISMDSLGLGTLAFATSPALGRDSGGNLWPLTLLPAFGHSKMPYVFMCGVEQDTKPAVVDRHSPSPTKPVTIRSKAQDQEQNGGSNIFAGRPPPSWALSAAEKNGKGPLSSAEDTPITVPVQPSPMVGIAEVGEAPQFSFFTSTQRRSSQEDMVDDLRIGLPTNSPLLAVYRPPPTPEMHQGAARTSTKGRASGTSWETPKVDKTSGKVRDMPVTFHDRVKSSGYGQNKPKQLSFAAKAKARPMLSTKGTGADVYNDRTTVAQPSLRSVSAPRHGKKSNAVPVGRLIRSYPTDCQPTLAHMPQNDFPCGDSRVERGAGERRAVGPLHGVRFSEDGTWAGLVSQDSAVETLKTPVGKHAGAGEIVTCTICAFCIHLIGVGFAIGLVYCGHDAGLTSICFSHCNGLMLSASKDGTARLWRIGRVEAPGVIFSHRCEVLFNAKSVL